MIICAVVLFGCKEFKGLNHAECIKQAMDSGLDVRDLNRWRDGYFLTDDGRIVDRDQAMVEFKINTSEQIPTQYGKPKLPTAPDPRRKK